MTNNKQYVLATYCVELEKQDEFLSLLSNAESVMRAEGLITEKPAYRMRSNENAELILEIFEWCESNSFEKAQENSKILELWGKFESVWKSGGFGLKEFPEAENGWAQFSSLC